MRVDSATALKRIQLRAAIDEAKGRLEPIDQSIIDLILEIMESEQAVNVSEIAREYRGKFATVYGQIGHALVGLRIELQKDRAWMEEHGFDPDRKVFDHNPVSQLLSLSCPPS